MINNDSTVQRSEKTSNIVHVKTPLDEVGKDRSLPSKASLLAPAALVALVALMLVVVVCAVVSAARWARLDE